MTITRITKDSEGYYASFFTSEGDEYSLCYSKANGYLIDDYQGEQEGEVEVPLPLKDANYNLIDTYDKFEDALGGFRDYEDFEWCCVCKDHTEIEGTRSDCGHLFFSPTESIWEGCGTGEFSDYVKKSFLHLIEVLDCKADLIADLSRGKEIDAYVSGDMFSASWYLYLNEVDYTDELDLDDETIQDGFGWLITLDPSWYQETLNEI